MFNRLTHTFRNADPFLRKRLLGIYVLLIGMNLLSWAWALVAFHRYPLLLGTALLAYNLGLRHAVDADHIAAIDNVTRKLLREGRRPVAVGLFFSLGHSSVVILASLGIATALTMQGSLNAFREIGGLIGTLVSTLFLFAIALMNLFILQSTWRTWRGVRHSGAYQEEDLERLLANRGWLSRLFRLIGCSWHMYPLGFLFGLGFDTATEIGLLGISAQQAAQGMPALTIMVFPALFCAGMSLVDTLDGHLMLGAYSNPVRRLYYNLTVTLASVVVALLVGCIEVLGLIAERWQLKGALWETVGMLNEHFGLLGYLIIGFFALSWLAAALLYRLRGYTALEG